MISGTIKTGSYVLCILICALSCREAEMKTVTVSVTMDHNRTIVEAEIQKPDSSWRPVRLWIDSGNPEFLLTTELARDLGLDSTSSATKDDELTTDRFLRPRGVQIGTMPIDFSGINVTVLDDPQWLFKTMDCEANLPSTVLKRYHVVFDYPALLITLSEPGGIDPKGVRCDARINPVTGIVQLDALICDDSLSLALDNGASYSFLSESVFNHTIESNANLRTINGAVGCANIWGWWPREDEWPMTRIPRMQWGDVVLEDVGIVGLPNYFRDGSGLFDWYSKKSAYPVDGLLGPNAFKCFRVGIDYQNSAVYFEKITETEKHDLDIVGITVRVETDGRYRIVGIAQVDGEPTTAGVEPGDIIIGIDGIGMTGATMGTVVDALRGNPGDMHTLEVDRKGERFTVEATVRRFL